MRGHQVAPPAGGAQTATPTGAKVPRVQRAALGRSAFEPSHFPRDGRPQVAFVGRSNVGKSTVLNRLLGRRGLAHTSSTPGRTRMVNFFLVNDRFYFVDLPGYGYARASHSRREEWAGLIEAYFDFQAPHLGVVLLVDGKVAGTRLDADAWRYLVDHGLQPMVVATKIDKVPRGKRRAAVERLRDRLELPAGQSVLEISARTGEGLEELWRWIAACL